MALDRLTIITSSGLSTVSDYVIDGLRAVGVVTASTVQVGSATTVHTTGVDLGSGNITSHNINSTGIITATGVTVTGDLTVEGTLAYDDVTNIDSVGVVTARSGLQVTGGNVGIGTDNPTTRLQVYRATQYANNPIIQARSNNGSTNELKFEIDGDGDAYFNGNVGIGLTNPSEKLHTIGDVMIQGTGGTGEQTLFIGKSATVLPSTRGVAVAADQDSSAFHDMVLKTSTNSSGLVERLRITSAGGVGIGTDTPYVNNSFTSLSIGGSGKYGLIELNKSDGVAGSWIDVYGTNGDGNLRFTTAGTSGAITFWTGGSFTEKLRITSAGTLESYSPDDTTPNIRWRSDDTNWFGALNQSVHGATITTFLSCGGDWSANGTTYSATKALAAYPTSAIAVHNQYNNSWGSQFVFLTKAGGSSTTDGAVTERLRIDSAGRLLLGTTTEGQVNADNLTVADSGNCGITIRSGTSNSGNLYFSDATSGTAEYDGAIAYDHPDQRMMLYTASTERLRITSSGIINSNNYSFNGQGTNTASDVYLGTFAPGSSAYAIATNGVERLRITSEGYPWIQNKKTTSFTNNSTVTILTIGSHNNTVVKFMVQVSDTGYRQHEWAGEYTAFVSDAAGSPGVSYYLKEHWQDFGSGNWNSPVVTVSINGSGQVQFNATNSNSDAGGTVYVTVLSVTSISSTIPTIS